MSESDDSTDRRADLSTAMIRLAVPLTCLYAGYLTDGTYQGTADGFISAWRAVAEACKSVAPDVKMFWTRTCLLLVRLCSLSCSGD